MDEAAFQRWLDRYVGAWKTYDEGAIGALFSEDAEYRYHPWTSRSEAERRPSPTGSKTKTTRIHGRPSTTRRRSKETTPSLWGYRATSGLTE